MESVTPTARSSTVLKSAARSIAFSKIKKSVASA
jgi:hypothetical protein